LKLWGGNYSAGPDKQFWEFNRSFPFDRRLLRQEVAASRAYARALGRCAAIPEADAQRLDAGLQEVLARAEQDPGYLETDAEDVHSFVESRLSEIVGELAGQGHLGRSRNEQAVTALRLWIREAVDGLRAALAELVVAFADQGEKGADAVMPGYTHIRAAEPISLGHFAACHAWALVRDRERLKDARRRVNVLPLGSGALAGTALPLDRDALARELGFEAISPNALDAVSDRDFATEFVFGCAQTQTHLSRIAEDLIWLSGPEFSLFELPEAFTTGSSLMPQKKNPDSLELVRGKAARVDSDLLRLLTLLKGLPAGYQKDLQEDKEAVFEAADTTALSLGVVTGVVRGLSPRTEVMRRAASREEMMAAGLAVALAREGMPFRAAHALVGSLVAAAPDHGGSLRAAAEAALPAVAPKLAARLGEIFDPDAAIRAKAAPGGTAPAAVRAALHAARERVRRD
jgi:argininosuccinate lyase